MKIKGVLRQRINKLAHARGQRYAKEERERLLNEFTTLFDEGLSFDELDRRLKLVEVE